MFGNNLTIRQSINFINKIVDQTLKEQEVDEVIWLAEVNIATQEYPFWIHVYKEEGLGTLGYRLDQLEELYQRVTPFLLTLEEMIYFITLHEIGHFNDKFFHKEYKSWSSSFELIQCFLEKGDFAEIIDKEFENYKKTLLRSEKRAWKLAKELLKETDDLSKFEFIKTICLGNYQHFIFNLERQIQDKKRILSYKVS